MGTLFSNLLTLSFGKRWIRGGKGELPEVDLFLECDNLTLKHSVLGEFH
jgi:hypothetical protein